MLLSHLQWAFWALLMMPYDKANTKEGVEECLSFYMEYAYARAKLYVEMRPIIMPREPSKVRSTNGDIQRAY